MTLTHISKEKYASKELLSSLKIIFRRKCGTARERNQKINLVKEIYQVKLESILLKFLVLALYCYCFVEITRYRPLSNNIATWQLEKPSE